MPRSYFDDPFWHTPSIPTRFSLLFLALRFIANPGDDVRLALDDVKHLLVSSPPTLLINMDKIVDAITYRLEVCKSNSFKDVQDADLYIQLLDAMVCVFSKQATAQAVAPDQWRRLIECIVPVMISKKRHLAIKTKTLALIQKMLKHSDHNLVYTQVVLVES
jgi:hypothetical protein